MSPFQIGAVPGHRSQEHLFSVKSVIAMLEEHDEAGAIQLFDLVAFFDCEMLEDVLGELYSKSQIKGKLYRLLHELNKNNKISVKTPVGESETKEIDKGITQGSISASLTSSSSLSAGVEDFFEESEEEVFYGNLKLLPQSFQDDLIRVCLNPQAAQAGNNRFQNLAETKLLSFNLKKTCITILGAKKAREDLLNEFTDTPPTLYGEPVKIVMSGTYLGDELGSTVSERREDGISKEDCI